MSPEALEIIAYIAVFLSSGALGYGVGRMRHQQEVREWQAIARRAQMLNRLADNLAQERSANGSRQHSP